MITAFTAEQVREAERPLLEAGVPLMARAAHALAGHALRLLREGHGQAAGTRVLLLIGGGNNGGDALFAGAELRRRGVRVRALLLSDHPHEGGLSTFLQAGGRLIDEVPDPAPVPHLVLDAIFGTGGRPSLQDAVRTVLDQVRELDVPVLAVDVPSGLDATTGQADPHTLPAHVTVTFGAVKTGLLLPAAAGSTGGPDLAGDIHLVDIGLGPHLPDPPPLRRLTAGDVARLWPRPGRASHKYSRGVVQVVAGSEHFPGAAVLATSSAARAGAGMVRIDAPRRVVDHVLAHRPEAVPGSGRCQAIVVGPGTNENDPRTPDALGTIRGGLPGVIDAGALAALGRDAAGGGSSPLHREAVLTPHAGEARRLAEDRGVDPDLPPADLARSLAAATGATVLLKGAVTLVAAPPDPGADPRADEDTPIGLTSQDDATSQLATAGAGDVLAGIVGSLLAAGLPGPDAAALGALVHGRAGRIVSRDGLVPLVALEVAAALPDALATILAEADESEAAEPGDS